MYNGALCFARATDNMGGTGDHEAPPLPWMDLSQKPIEDPKGGWEEEEREKKARLTSGIHASDVWFRLVWFRTSIRNKR